METTVVPESTAVKDDYRPLSVKRHFVDEGAHPFDTIEWVTTDAVLIGADGVEKFRQDGVEVPSTWSDNTINIVVEKYFRVVSGVKEFSAKQMFNRVAIWITQKGVGQSVILPEDSNIFHLELLHLLVNGMYAFNSPVWFNVGVKEDPQCSACFIQGVDDTMSDIMDLAKREVMLFKGGSGTGANLSSIRSSWEKLSGGGYASGPVSFMKGYDAFAGVTKSGGTTRRAAKMNVLDADHPDIIAQRNGLPGFIGCKADAEREAQALYETGKYSAEWNIRGNVYDRVGYQNANHSVRVSDDFMQGVVDDSVWTTKYADGSDHRHYQAKEMFEEMSDAAHLCGDPGLQFKSIINEMHTCPNSGEITATNPCSEYLFLNNSACNLGSLNLMKFAKHDGFLVNDFLQAIDIAIIAKEIIVDAASYPSPQIAEMSHKFRPLGLGYANLGALLTFWGLPYDSDEGRNVAALITSLMGGRAYDQSAILAMAKGPFQEYEKNREPMLAVIERHLESAREIPVPIDKPWTDLAKSSMNAWISAYSNGKMWGFRNAQTTLLAPTGTISFLMDCDTTGIEPMLGVVVYKKIVGEGVLMLPSRVVGPALLNLGYDYDQIGEIENYIRNNGDIHGAPGFKEEHNEIFAGSLGSHALKPQGHIDMMAAVQPFLSGGISKTVNMPEDATSQDVADIYMKAWRGGLKCVAIYRSGCKLSQPVATKLEHKDGFSIRKWGERKDLPNTRNSVTHKFRVANVKGYITAGEYPDGTLAEIFVRISKQGSFLGGILECFAQSVSFGIQHGVPVKLLCDKFKGTSFEPAGFTGDDEISIAKSIIDYLFRWIELRYLSEEEPKKAEASGSTIVKPPIQVVDLTIAYDGPPCSDCGSLTKRSGSCFLCSNCGATTGCS